MDPQQQPPYTSTEAAPEDTTITNSTTLIAGPPAAATDPDNASPSAADSPSPASIPYHPVSYSAPSSRPSTGHHYSQNFGDAVAPQLDHPHNNNNHSPEDLVDRYSATSLDQNMSASQSQYQPNSSHSHSHSQSQSHLHQQPSSRPSSGLAGHQTSSHSSQHHQQQHQQFQSQHAQHPPSSYDYQSRPPAGASASSSSSAAVSAAAEQARRDHVVIKVGMVGDAQIGKTSLMVKYVEGSWDEDYIQTLGVNFMEKTISIRNTEITFSIWDLGGQREFVNMLPLVCNDAVAILFMFDLTRKSTLNSIKEWYRQGRGFNKTAIPILVGTKYDHFVNFPREEQEEISNQARRFAKAMRAALIFSSTSHSINVQKIFKIVLSKAFDLKCTIPEIENVGEPLLLYQNC
ncbi:Septum-promoting GTP-binding protein 1 [Ceratocystis platani]|uniref:Septum-promoting GTP-binding protein 1 n=1 Tax=Ceratocystis fimbriata f. sp. platani TaxID=88771 RepID=A0A0F8BMW1_CERFI|nr:Septum-promoting GTP-binding protein 1 [Ceratocystis platani]